jgi:hypothetical protein
MTVAGKATAQTTGHVTRLHEGLERLGPVGASVSQRFDALGLSSRVAGGGIVAMGAAAALAAVAMGKGAVDAASDLNEQISRTQVVFGSASEQIVKFARTADASLGLSETAALSAASAFGGMFRNAGLTDEATAKMSTTLTGLSGDLASFMNLQGGSQEAAEKLTMGLTGQLEVLRELGVFISDVDVVAEVMRLGLEKTTAQITESDKIVARYNLILQKTGTAQGDFARTADGAANQQRILNAEMANSQATIGTGLLPIWNKLLGAGAQIIDMTQHVGETFTRASDATHGWAGKLGEVASKSTPIGQLGDAIGRLADMHGKGSAKATDYSTAQAKAADVQKTYAAATKAAEQAQQSLNDAILSAFDKDLAYQRSILASKDAVDAYNQAVKDAAAAIKGYGVNSQQAKDAQEALTKAQIDVQSSALGQAAAAAEAGRQQATLAGGTYSARDAVNAEIASLQSVRATLAPGSPLAAAIDAYIVKLQSGIPKQIQTHFSVVFSSSGAISTSGEAFIPRASGGPVLPGHAYTVGEHGPERLLMGQAGGVVLPHGSGGPVEVSNLSTARVERLLAQQNLLLAQIARAPATVPAFSTTAYGR